MLEKRKYKRLPANLELEISSLFKQDNVKVENFNAPIEIFDISRSGIGFKTKAVLPIGYYFNAKLVLGSDDSNLYCVVNIVRASQDGDDNVYGCEFVGLAPVLSYIFDEYEKRIEE